MEFISWINQSLYFRESEEKEDASTSRTVTYHQHLFFFSFWLFRATPAAYGGSQARGQIGAVATSLRHSHSSARPRPCLRPNTTAHGKADPSPAEQG